MTQCKRPPAASASSCARRGTVRSTAGATTPQESDALRQAEAGTPVVEIYRTLVVTEMNRPGVCRRLR
jgi:hypothetical protein